MVVITVGGGGPRSLSRCWTDLQVGSGVADDLVETVENPRNLLGGWPIPAVARVRI
jgi:hypothetical protein